MIKLYTFLKDWAGEDRDRKDVARIITSMAGVGIRLAERISNGRISADFAEIVGDNADGDAQKALDVEANEVFLYALKGGPTAAVISEENEEPVILDQKAPLMVAMDPLDGSSNVDTNVSIGTIFSILPAPEAFRESDPAAPNVEALLQKGDQQLAAGFIIYGPQTALVLTLGEGVNIFTLDRAAGKFLLTYENVQLPEAKNEYAINASNYRHWDKPVRSYIDECVSGEEGPRAQNFNMRWIASLVAEAYRIFIRGGIFMYPADGRKGYGKGRLRLVYEANPIAFLIEQAGGGATEGHERIMAIQPSSIHQRIPFTFGSIKMVERYERYHTDPDRVSDHAPLFGSRSIFR